MADTIIIHAPQTGWSGEVVGAVFAKGLATVPAGHPSIGYFRRHGYGIGEPAGPPPPPTTAPAPLEVKLSTLRDAATEPPPSSADEAIVGPPSGNASTDEWRAYAESFGLEVPEDAGRDAIRALVDAST